MNEEKTKAVRVELHILSVSASSSSNDDSRQKVSNGNLQPNPLQSGSSPARVARVHFCQGYFRRPRVPARAPQASSRDTSVGKYAKVYLNDQLYGQTETTYFDTATSQFEFGSKGIYFDIPIPRIALGIDEAGRDITLYIEVYKSYKNSLSKDVLIGTSQINPFEIILSTKELRRTKDGTLASKERQEKRAFFHKKLSQSSSASSFGSLQSVDSQMSLSGFETINPLTVIEQKQRAHEVFPKSGLSILPMLRQRKANDTSTSNLFDLHTDGDIEICGEVEVSVGLIVPSKLEKLNTVLEVEEWVTNYVEMYRSTIRSLKEKLGEGNKNAENDHSWMELMFTMETVALHI